MHGFPERLKDSVGGDMVTIKAEDEESAIKSFTRNTLSTRNQAMGSFHFTYLTGTNLSPVSLTVSATA